MQKLKDESFVVLQQIDENLYLGFNVGDGYIVEDPTIYVHESDSELEDFDKMVFASINTKLMEPCSELNSWVPVTQRKRRKLLAHFNEQAAKENTSGKLQALVERNAKLRKTLAALMTG